MEETNVKITIHNIKGQIIKELLNERKSPGVYTDLTWDGKNDSGEIVASGVYIIYINIINQ